VRPEICSRRYGSDWRPETPPFGVRDRSRCTMMSILASLDLVTHLVLVLESGNSYAQSYRALKTGTLDSVPFPHRQHIVVVMARHILGLP
jgi:hypothetical protein